MTIGELSRTTGIAQSAIRFYESEGLLPAAVRKGGRRVFDEDAVARVGFIQLAKEAGFSLTEIRRLIRDFEGERWTRLAETKLAELDATARRIRKMQALLRPLLACGCFDVKECGSLVQSIR